MFECGKCGYTTKRKWSFDYHNNRKIPCEANPDQVKKKSKVSKSEQIGIICPQITTPIQCEVCLKVFNTISAKYKHKKKPISCIKVTETLDLEGEVHRLTVKTLALEILINKKDKVIEKKDAVIENMKMLGFEVEMLPPKSKPKQKPKRSFVTQITKAQIAASQKWCCRICTTLFTGIYHMDHTIPLSFGGEDNRENVTALCVQCHAEKSQNEWKERADMKHLTVESLQT